MSIARDDFDYTRNVYASPACAWDSVARAEPKRTALWLFFSFDGRSTRSQYWSALVLTIMAYFGMILLLATFSDRLNEFVRGGVALTCMIAYFWASLAIQVKRWHDRGKSGIWVLVQIIPFVGPLWTFIELGCLPGEVFDNDYGPSECGQLFQREERAPR